VFFVFAWCLKDEAAFNEIVPLDLVAESYRRHGSTVPITVVFLEGFAALSKPYLDGLEGMGMRFIDFTAGFGPILAAFPNICDRYSHYERNCFLRWIAFQEIYRSSGLTGQVWHLDGDVILHTSTDSIAEDTASKTFVLQGCPVLVSISDPKWFSIYREELEKLDADIEGYSAKAHALKPAISARSRELCNVTQYRNPLGSDQDLLEYLISARILMQDRAERIFASGFYFIQNPLVARYWDDLQSGKHPGTVSETANGELRFGDRIIPFTHYQNSFCHYSAIYLVLAGMGLGRFTPHFTNPRQSGEGGASLRFRALSALLRKAGVKIPTRRRLIMDLAGKRPGASATRLTDVINHING
jgi:hypothetical protein